MLRYVDKVVDRKTGETKRIYTINQGDTFTFYAQEQIAEGGERLIKGFKFKLGKSNYSEFFSQDYIELEDGRFMLKVHSEDTQLWEVTEDEPYWYEIEAEYIDGNKVSITLYEFNVDYQVGDN